MKRNKESWIAVAVSLVLSMSSALRAAAAEVDELEAMEIADLWYREASMSKRPSEAERLDSRDALNNSKLWYLGEDGELYGHRPEVAVAAYVIRYAPVGWVAVSADDRSGAIIAYSTKTALRWGDAKSDPVRAMLATDCPARNRFVRVVESDKIPFAEHPTWSALRWRVRTETPTFLKPYGAPVPPPAPAPGTTMIQWETPVWGQRFPYNETAKARNGGLEVPTGCTATAMAMKMRSHAWPNAGIGGVHSYKDNDGAIRLTHSMDYNTVTFDWKKMPYSSLATANAEVSNLMYSCGVSANMDYEVSRSGAWVSAAKKGLYDHFRYVGIEQIESKTTTDHVVALKHSLVAGLPVIVRNEKHTMLIDGFQDQDMSMGFFHLNCGWADAACDVWYNLNELPGGPSYLITDSLPYAQPSNYVYLDKLSAGTMSGQVKAAYNTVKWAVKNTPRDGHLWIKKEDYTGIYSVPMTFTDMTIRSYAGTASIGGRLHITTKTTGYIEPPQDAEISDPEMLTGGRIRIRNGHKLTIASEKAS